MSSNNLQVAHVQQMTNMMEKELVLLIIVQEQPNQIKMQLITTMKDNGSMMLINIQSVQIPTGQLVDILADYYCDGARKCNTFGVC